MWLAAAGHEELHDALGLRRVMQPAIGPRFGRIGAAHHRGQRDAAEPTAGM